MRSFKELVERAKEKGIKRCVVARAEDEAVLEGIRLATELGIITPVLVGDRTNIERIARMVGLDTSGCEIHDEPEENGSIVRAIAIVREKGDFLMKGMLSTSTFLKGILNKETGLRKGTILSHIAAFEIPGYHKLLFMSDGGMNPKLDLKTRVSIIQNAIDALYLLGIATPKVGMVAASETLNPDMPETVDAAEIAAKARAGEFPGAVVDGPFGFDVAVSEKAAEAKNIASPVAGDVDFLLMPNISAANIWAKGLIYFGGTKAAGMVAGAQRPIIMLSRADDPETKLNSIALGVILAQG